MRVQNARFIIESALGLADKTDMLNAGRCWISIPILLLSLTLAVGCGRISGSIRGHLGEPSTSITLKLDEQTLPALIGEGTANALVAVLSEKRTKDTVVNLLLSSTRNDQATDFTQVPTTVTIPAGSLAKSFNLISTDDSIYEGSEAFAISLSSSDPEVMVGSAQATLIVTDNDSPPSLSIDDVTSGSEAGSVTFTVTLTGSTALSTTVQYAAQNSTAMAGADYTSTTDTLTFAAGTTVQTFTVAILADVVDEPTEIFNVVLSSAINATISDNAGIGTITDDDSPPSVSFALGTQPAAEDSGTVLVALDLSGPSGYDVTIPLAASGTATGAGADYALGSTTITILAGQTTANASIALVNDSTYETPDETVILTMGAPSGASQGATTSYTLTITNDDLSTFVITGATGGTDATADAYLSTTLNPTINWNASSAATATYEVTVFENDGTTVKCGLTSVSAPTTSHNFSSCNLTAATNYKAKVTAKNTGGVQSLDASNSLFSFYTNRSPAAVNDGPMYIFKDSATVTLSVLADNPATGPIDPDTDADGDTLSISAVSDPLGGSAAISGTDINYTPDSGFTGTDFFTYTASDGKGGVAIGTVSIRVVSAHTWTGGAGSGNWSTAGNWCGSINASKRGCLGTGTVPGAGDTAIFDGTCTANFSPTTTANISLNGSSGFLVPIEGEVRASRNRTG